LKEIKCIHNTGLDCPSQQTSVLLADFHATSSFSSHTDYMESFYEGKSNPLSDFLAAVIITAESQWQLHW